MSQGRRFAGSVHLAPEGFGKHTGGVRRAAFELLNGLRRAGTTVTVAPWLDKTSPDLSMPAPSAMRRALLQAGDALLLARERLRRPTVVVHSLYYDPSIMVARQPIVATVYDMIHERFGAGGRYLKHAKRTAVERADVVVAISQATADDVREAFPHVRDVRVVHLGVAGSILNAPTVSTTPRTHLLYVGQRAGYKNFGLLLRSLERSPDLRSMPLTFVGGGPLLPAERDSLRRLSMAPVIHRGTVSEEELVDLYDRALVLVVPSRCEGFGLPVLEAMTRQCPVACSTAPSLVEIAAGHAAHFDPDEPDELAEAVVRAVAISPVERGAARAYAASFTWDRVAAAHLDIYERTLSLHQPS